MEQKQMEQTLTGLLLTAICLMRGLEPCEEYIGEVELFEAYDKIRDTAGFLVNECWSAESGVRTILEDMRLHKIVAAIEALRFSDEERKSLNFYASNSQGSPFESP